MKTNELVTTEAELRAAIAAGGEVYVDTGTTITLSSPVVVDVPVRIIGGSYSVPDGTGFHVTSSNVEFNRIKIGGGWSYSGGFDSAQKLIHVQGTSAAPLENISIHDSFMSGSRADNVWLEWVRDAYVNDNIIKRFLYSGVMQISCDGVVVNGNNIWDSPLIGQLNCYGIAVTDADNTVAARSRNITITGNRVHLIDWEAIDTHGGDGITIAGNTVTASPRGIALVTGNSTRVTAPENCMVSGNFVDSRGSRQTVREGVLLGGIANTPADGTVVGNHIIGYGDDALVANYYDRGKTRIGSNNVPFQNWRPLPLGEDFTANTTYPPEYMVDGDTVHFRGGVIPKSASQRTIISVLPSIARPSVLTTVSMLKGSNASAGEGVLGVWPDGRMVLMYQSGTDTYTYFLHGSYEAI
ncbi:right-handed parallel beta-helix repeat-containing protein [Amycolatopsis palatopharyngis]|uniref:right-handed parallel beta-helix repeat-containing protein n=1 Tax=Amycolatopsis palatopharyngis TaxID=187982 RepID=UPI000E22B6FD|nr:right-handed parallel beta-helix repeat-containing protein [Amycolatopsis palatopharyngis]